jgi:DNA polymerase IV
VKFDPYIPQCIQSAILLDPAKARFLVKGAPRLNEVVTQLPPDSQTSPRIKSSRRELAANLSQNTDSVSTEDTPVEQHRDDPISSGDIVKDSFMQHPESPVLEVLEIARLPETFDDDLSKAIQQTKAVAHLPLDDEEEGDLRPASSAGKDSESDIDEEAPQSSPKRTRCQTFLNASRKKIGLNQKTFQCMDPAGASSITHNPNARTIEVLEQMGEYYDQMQDPWRTLAYRKAVTTLRRQFVRISSAKEAAALPFIGSRLADKIEEIVLTDRLRRLDSTRDDPTDKVLRLFLGIYGAGLVQASKWIQAGHRTLDDLLANAKLTDSQKVGIEHYHDFATRIPRAEVKAHADYVRDALQRIDPGFQATVMGSYRRGAKDSGDIDMIITKPGATVSTLRGVAFHTLVPRLQKNGFLKVKLATSSSTDDGTKWHGASCLPSSNRWRRLDLLLVPQEEMGAALLYFTGNNIFNRSIRLLASKKGMRLNQRGLYKDVVRGRNREKLNEPLSRARMKGKSSRF